MTDSDIIMEDIRKALELINEEMPPNKTYKIPGGWIETNGFGTPIKIGLDKDTHELIKEIAEMDKMVSNAKTKLETIYGIKVVKDLKSD